ncbi:MAG: LysR family transcriptional regulator [Acidihalobacter sp.]
MTNWEDLRHFVAVAQSGSLSGAARALKVDHATVSRRLAALEDRLQVRLVERLPRSCRLTAMGERVLEFATQMEDQAFAIERAARGEQAELSGRVTLSASPMLVERVLAERLGDFRARYPRICLSLAAQRQLVSLGRREADLALRMSRPAELRSVARKLGRVEFALYASRDYPRLHDPEGWEFIVYDASVVESFPHGDWMQKATAGRGIACEVTSSIGQLVAARAGAGVASLPCFLGDAEEKLQRLPVTDAPFAFDEELWLVVHRDLTRAAPVRAVMDFVIEVICAEGSPFVD